MLWRIIGILGVLTFFYSGFTVLADPECVTADIGGGRVIGVTCRNDVYGSFTGATAGFLMLLGGATILMYMFWSYTKSQATGPKNLKNLNGTRSQLNQRSAAARTTSIKSCDKCGKEMETKWGHCPVCLGTTFTHKQLEFKPFQYSSEEAMSDAFPAPTEPKILIPEFKDCPMCAEQIKFAAKKCRYCGSMI